MICGKEQPRIFTPPLRELTPDTTIGFEVIEFSEIVLGMNLLPWQKWLLIHALEIVNDPFDGWPEARQTFNPCFGSWSE